jgi:transcription antitermination factor NusG
MNKTGIIADKKDWYVIYTRSRAEKKVYSDLRKRNIECFLPLQKRLRKWKDRKKWIEMPLISGYCFVYINRKEYDEVLKSDSVVGYVTFEGKAAVVPEFQIKQFQIMLHQSDFEITVLSADFIPGRQVEIINGPLTGLRGELIDCRGKKRFILRIEQIKNVFSVEIPASDLALLPELVNKFYR